MNFHEHCRLDPDLDFLNHGSFGAVPRVVTAAQRAFQDELEADPIEFLAPERDFNPKLDHVRRVIAELIGADSRDLAFVRNVTDGVNAVLRSLPLRAGDEILVTSHGYNACVNAAEYVAENCGAIVRVADVPFPLCSGDDVINAIEREIGEWTRLLLIDHVTSPTGIVFPIEVIVELAHQRGARILCSGGAHAAGEFPKLVDSRQRLKVIVAGTKGDFLVRPLFNDSFNCCLGQFMLLHRDREQIIVAVGVKIAVVA